MEVRIIHNCISLFVNEESGLKPSSVRTIVKTINISLFVNEESGLKPVPTITTKQDCYISLFVNEESGLKLQF